MTFNLKKCKLQTSHDKSWQIIYVNTSIYLKRRLMAISGFKNKILGILNILFVSQWPMFTYQQSSKTIFLLGNCWKNIRVLELNEAEMERRQFWDFLLRLPGDLQPHWSIYAPARQPLCSLFLILMCPALTLLCWLMTLTALVSFLQFC